MISDMSFGAVLLIRHVIVFLVPRRGSKKTVSNQEIVMGMFREPFLPRGSFTLRYVPMANEHAMFY